MISEKDRLQVLMVDYEASREDVRGLESVRANIVGFALASLTVVGAIAATDCRILGGPCADGGRKLPDLLLSLTPLVPAALMTYLALAGIGLVQKSFYLRRLEREIRGIMLDSDGNRDRFLPMWAEVEVQMSRFSRGTVARPLFLLLLTSALFIFGGYTILIFTVVSSFWQAITVGFYGLALVVIFHRSWLSLRHGRSVYLDLETRAKVQLNSDGLLNEKKKRKGILCLHLFPRSSVDFITKGVLILVGSFTALALGQLIADAAHVTVRTVSTVVVIALCFELGAYHARYLINDFRGFGQDAEHPDARGRRRLPEYYETQRDALRPVLANIVIRLSLATLVILALDVPQDLEFWLVIFVFVLAVTATAYDLLREVVPQGRGRNLIVAMGIHILVGSGYALRVGVGLVAATYLWQLEISPANMIYTVGFFWLFGVLLVSLSWALDAMSYVNTEIFADQKWMPRQVEISSVLWNKPHMAWHLNFLGLRPASVKNWSGAADQTLAGLRVKFLSRGDRLCLWRLIPTAAATLGALLWVPFLLRMSTGVIILGVIGGLLLAWFATRGTKSRLWTTIVGLLNIIILLIWRNSADGTLDLSTIIVCLIPWLLVSIINVMFRSQSRYDQLYAVRDGWRDRVRPRLLECYIFIVRLVLGKSYAKSLEPAQSSSS